jgi:hypothetical protein
VRKILFCLAAFAAVSAAVTTQSTKKSAAKAPARSASSAKTGTAKKPSTAASKKPAASSSKAAASKSGTSKTTSTKAASSKSGKKGARQPAVTWRSRQTAPTADRYRDIQRALAAKGYLPADSVTGQWGTGCVDALKRFQAEQNLEATGKINSLSLIALGLGPNHNASTAKPAGGEAAPPPPVEVPEPPPALEPEPEPQGP